MSHSTIDKCTILKDRAYMLTKSREFFFQRKVLEVDCPILTKGASVDTNIDLIPAFFNKTETRYMHSSPEYGMKRLLADGIGDIYQLSHVFRDGEISPKHNPEFMMAEWYRLGFTFQEMIEETLDYIRLFLGSLNAKLISYRELFLKYANFDYVVVSNDFLVDFLINNGIEPYPGIEDEGKDALLNVILGTLIEPKLGLNELVVLYHYPASQAALAKTKNLGDEIVAERFEVYYQGVELANGYHELVDAKEQRQRFIESNVERIKLNKDPLPIDEYFLSALEKGLPSSCGVAVGFDRLMMLRHKTKHIEDVIPFVFTNT